jgi:hypothetical protein
MNISKSQSIRASVIGLLVLVTAMTAGAAPAPIDNLSRYFAGMYRGVTPGNNLTLQVTPVTINLSNPYDYFVTVSGQFEKTNIREQALLRIETQGDSIHIGYIPHFNPAVSGISPSVGRFSPDELNAACGLYLRVEGDGFGGETRPSDCARAIRGTAGRSWRVEIEPNRITLKDAKTGETLRFEKEEKAK